MRAHPRSRYVAELVGLNLFHGHAIDGVIGLAGGEQLVAADDDHLAGEVFAAVHPRAVALYRERPQGSPRNVWPGKAEGLEVAGDRVRVRVGGAVPLVAEVTPAAVSALHLDDGGLVLGLREGYRGRGLPGLSATARLRRTDERAHRQACGDRPSARRRQ